MGSFHGFTMNVETLLFLPVANPEIPLHIGKAGLYDNTSPTWEIFSPAISKMSCVVWIFCFCN